MPRTKKTTETQTADSSPGDVVAQVKAALASGAAPRGRKALQDAIRTFRQAGDIPGAVDALATLARMETRRGQADRGLTAARSAVRLARSNGHPDGLRNSLALLAELSQRHGDADRALEAAREATLQAKGSPAEALAALRLALVLWEQGERSEAVVAVEQVQRGASGAPEAERLLAGMLLALGCPATAEERLTRLLRRGPGVTEEVHALLLRGWAWVCLGRPDRAARDFRKARRSSGEVLDRRLEARAVALLGYAESVRAGESAGEARSSRAAAAFARAQRMARRLKDQALAERIRALQTLLAEPTPADDLRVAARALVELASRTESLTVADACHAEVQRLAQSAPGTPPYAAPFALPFPLELAVNS